MKKTKCSAIKLSKYMKPNFYNVTSSYNHLLEKISNELKIKEQIKSNSQMKQNSLHKGSNSNSINYSKKLSFSKGKVSPGTVSFELSDKNNDRMNTDVNSSIKKARNLSPGFNNTIKKLKAIQKNIFDNQFESKNNINSVNCNLKSHQPYFNVTNVNIKEKRIKLTKPMIHPIEDPFDENTNTQNNKSKDNIPDNNAYEEDVCLTEPYQNQLKQLTIYPTFKDRLKSSKYKTQQSNSLDLNGDKCKVSRIKSANNKKSIQNNSSQSKDITKNNKFNDLNININTNINTNININTNQPTIPIQSSISKNAPLREPEIISINSLFNSQDVKIDINLLSEDYPQYDQAKASNKSINNIKAYGANTYQGIIRNYNEDRVSIILNIAQPPGFEGNWPKCSLFSIYDGHGGNACADFLRDKLHTFIIKNKYFPSNPQEALKKGFKNAEEYFINNISVSKDHNKLIEKSGSCAILALIIENICYVANVGDSRAIISLNKGKDVRVLTTDHKPNEDYETKRIVSNGGKIYQTQTPTSFLSLNSYGNTTQILLGPYRVFPGRLSVSRTIGDAEAKLPQFGGIPYVIIAEPEITYFSIDEEIDFLMMGCDGIFDQMTNEEVSECVWATFQSIDVQNVHSQCAIAVDMIMKASLARKTLDNITVILIAFKNFEKEFNFCSAQRKYNDSLLTHNSNNNITINDSYQNNVLVTEPTYNFAHEKIVRNDFKHKPISKEKNLSPPNSSNNPLLKNNLKQYKQKASHFQPHIPLSPKIKTLFKDTSKTK